MRKSILAVFLAFMLVFLGMFSLIGHADFGDFAGDYDYGGDWGGGNDYDYDWGNDDDYDYDYGGNDGGYYYYGGSSGGSSSGDGSGSVLGGLIFIIVIVVIIVILVRKRKGSSGVVQPQQPVAAGATATDPSTLRPVQEYLNLDPTFSEAQFKEKLSNLYVQFQNAWQDKDLESLRPYLSDMYYAQVDRQLDNYRRNNQTPHVERISVLGVTLTGWKQENGNDVMIARLNTRITTYVTNDANGDLVRGSRTAEKFMDYEWEVIRASGKTTVQEGGMTVQNCPNCGATININHTAKCEYCGSIITVDSYDWVVNSIKGISQRTVG